MSDFVLSYTVFASAESSGGDLIFKILSIVLSVVALLITAYVTYLGRKWKKEKAPAAQVVNLRHRDLRSRVPRAYD